MKTKEEVIKEAWGEYWGMFSSQNKAVALECNGWAIFGYSKEDVKLFNIIRKDKRIEGHDMYRPKSIAGIENNNGWIRIESEEDLPPLMVSETEANRKMYEACFYDGDNFNLSSLSFFCHNLIQGYRDAHWTHYREYVKPKPPIY